MKEVSLIVPVYNMECYLERCMEGLLSQTNLSYEIILVDDGSTDASVALIDQFAMKYPDFVKCIHKQNGGLSSARNAGMNIASGKYVTFPDPDDWVEFDYVEQFLKLQKMHDAELVCTGYYINYDNYRILANEGENSKQMSASDAKKALLIPPCMGGFAWNKLYDMNIIKKNKLKFLNDVGITEDLDFAFRYLDYCNTVFFAPDVRTYHYYQRKGAATHSKFSWHKVNSIRTYEKIIASCTECSDIVQAANEEICNIALNLLWSYEKDCYKDVNAKKILMKYLKKTLIYYLQSKRYNTGRKIQAIIACLSPTVYCKMKKVF